MVSIMQGSEVFEAQSARVATGQHSAEARSTYSEKCRGSAVHNAQNAGASSA